MELQHFHQPRASHQSVVLRDYLYILGGYYYNYRSNSVVLLNDVQYMNIGNLHEGYTSNNRWCRTQPFQRARSGHGCVVYNNHIYIIGGGDGIRYFSDVQYSAIEEDGSVSLAGWKTSKNSLVFPRSAHGCGVFVKNDKTFIYVAGGAGIKNGNTIHFNSVEYAPIHSGGSVGEWSLCNSHFSEGRAHCGVVIINDHLYVVGGWGDEDIFADVQHTPILTDGSLGEWVTNRSTLNFSRLGQTTVFYNHAPLQALFVLGGAFIIGRREGGNKPINKNSAKRRATGRGRYYNGTSSYLGDVQYSIINADGTSPWIPLSTELDFAPPRWGHTSIIEGNNLFVIGGQSNTGEFLNDIQMIKLNSELFL